MEGIYYSVAGIALFIAALGVSSYMFYKMMKMEGS